jgi:valyl-tRNA synthetase
MKEIDKRYNPEKYEKEWAECWVKEKTFASSPDGQPPYTIVIPPPNVTGVLHMGHALNNVLQDIIIRVHKILGHNTMWMPGTDHGGIATQNVVEKMLMDEGITRDDLGRDKFLARMWKWKKESGETIIQQLKRLGCGCDWDRLRFTMDEQCSGAVEEAFVRLFEKGFIYRGEYMINWCPRCGTALSDIEVEHEEKKSSLWYIKYPIKRTKSAYVEVATTRPETMLGDTAVAVNPNDERYMDIIGKKVILPVIGREIEIIGDDFVDTKFGTGAVKVTPAHDPNDFEMAKRHSLESVRVIDEKGRMTDSAGPYKGQDRFKCRKNLVDKLKKEGLLVKIEDYTHSVAKCYRCFSIIEPLISEQWFLKMRGLADSALDASKKHKIKFVPSRWEKPYINWLENIYDWCISRQIWWGHRIPVFYCADCDSRPIVQKGKPGECPSCGSKNIAQDEDVLDTWFSSALWPFSTLGWPRQTEELKYYYPTKVLVTGHEILYLWVARMVMMGLEMMGDIPFDKVNIHGIIRDEHGNKMSKSKGNVIDPMDIIKEYGTDALRFALAKSAVPGRDIQLSKDDFVEARNFANKLWNAARLILANIEIKEIQEPDMSRMELADKWILYEARRFARRIKRNYLDFNNARAARLAYEFTWSYFCDWYLEIAKLRLYSTKPGKETTEAVLVNVLVRILGMLHPVMPFISSQLWKFLSEELRLPSDNPLGYNVFKEEPDIDEQDVGKMNLLVGIVNGIRNARGELSIQPSVNLNAKVQASGEDKKFIEDHMDYLKLLGKLDDVRVGPDVLRGSQDTVIVSGGIPVFLTLSGELIKEEMTRLKKRKEDINKQIEYSNRKLMNRDFTSRAPEEIVKREKDRAKKLEDDLAKLNKNLREITR